MQSAGSTARSPREARLVDDAVLAYVEWREECLAVGECYGRWVSATGGDAAGAHAAYRAALDREEAAASAYAERLGRLGDLLPSSEQVRGGRHGDHVLAESAE